MPSKTTLKYDINGLSYDVNPKIKECNKYLNIADQMHSSIKIPDDFKFDFFSKPGNIF